MKNETEKATFKEQLKTFSATLPGFITNNNEWTIRGFIDIFKNIRTISSDTKIVSKILELHLFPHFYLSPKILDMILSLQRIRTGIPI